MNILTIIYSAAILLTSVIEALPGPLSSLVITSPTAGSTFVLGGSISVTVENGIGATVLIPTVLLTFASPCGSFTQVVPVGSTQILNLPCNVSGQVTIAAKSGPTRAESVQIFVTPAYANYPDVGCADIACPPRASRSRRGCGYYAEEVGEIAEFKAHHLEDESH